MRPSVLSIPAVVLFELEFGTLGAREGDRRREQLNRLISVIKVLPFTEAAAVHAAHVRFTLEKAGITIGPLDTLIAGTALAHGAVLVTNNVREFSRVPGLLVEDWIRTTP